MHRAGHGLVLEDALLPVGERGAVSSLVFKLGPLEVRAVEVAPHLLDDARSHHEVDRAGQRATPHLPRSLHLQRAEL